MAQTRKAIISCHDKTGIIEFAKALADFNFEILATSGTKEYLRENGVECTGLSEYTGSPELLDGRVKSLHPKIHAGLLGIRDNDLHQDQLEAQEYDWIDMLVVNLHPVESIIARPHITQDEVIDQIDIGGNAMIRSAAKNFRYVSVIVDPADYARVLHELRANDGAVSYGTRHRLATEAFEHTARYDQVITEYLKSVTPAEE